MIDRAISDAVHWLIHSPDWQLWVLMYVNIVILIFLIRSVFKKKSLVYKLRVDNNKLNDVDLSYIKVNKDILHERSEKRSTNNNYKIEDHESDQSSERIDGFEPARV